MLNVQGLGYVVSGCFVLLLLAPPAVAHAQKEVAAGE
jgi:hypothetical protein